MRGIFAILFVSMLSAGFTAFADKPVDTGYLPPEVRRAIAEWKGEGDLKKVITHRDEGRLYYEVQYKEHGDEKVIYLRPDGSIYRNAAGGGFEAEQGDREQGREESPGRWERRDRDRENRERDEAWDKRDDRNGGAAARETDPAETRVPPPADGADGNLEARLTRHVNAINQTGQNPRLKSVALRQVARQTGKSVELLRQQEKRYGNAGPGALLMGNAIANDSDATLKELFAERRQGKSWVDIAEKENVSLDRLVAKAENVRRAVSSAARSGR